MNIHHLTHIDNLRGIIKNGILCRNSLQDNYKDTADPNIISERKILNNYVPFHINVLQKDYGIPYNYNVLKRYGKENMIFLLKTHSVCNSDLLFLYHPISDYAQLFKDISKYKNAIKFEILSLPEHPIFGGIDYSNNRVKQFLMSEVLIKNSVPFSEIIAIVVFNDSAKIKVDNILQEYNIIDKKVFVYPEFFK